MRSNQLLIVAVALPMVLLLWWVAHVESELSALHAEMDYAQSVLPDVPREDPSMARAEAPREASASGPENAEPAPTGFERTLEDLQQAKDRIAALEGTVHELADAWNKFAEEEEARRAQAAVAASGNGFIDLSSATIEADGFAQGDMSGLVQILAAQDSANSVLLKAGILTISGQVTGQIPPKKP